VQRPGAVSPAAAGVGRFREARGSFAGSAAPVNSNAGARTTRGSLAIEKARQATIGLGN